jgi:hypothetical protein
MVFVKSPPRINEYKLAEQERQKALLKLIDAKE